MSHDFDFEYGENCIQDNENTQGISQESESKIDELYLEDIRRQISETEEEYEKWNYFSHNIKDVESSFSYDNSKNLEIIDMMGEKSKKSDKILSQLWETKAALIYDLNRHSVEFHEIFEEEDRMIKMDYEDKVGNLYNELRLGES